MTPPAPTTPAQLPSAAMLSRFFELALDLVCVVNAAGAFTQVNPAFRRTLGWGRSELIGRAFLDFVHPDDVAATRAALTELAQSQSKGSVEHRFLTRDGAYKRFHWQAQAEANGIVYAVGREATPAPAPPPYANGHTNGHANGAGELRSSDSGIRHRTELALREKDERLRALSEATLEGLVFHEQGVILEINVAALNMIGALYDEVIGRNILDFVPAEMHALALEKMRQPGKVDPYEIELLRRDGRRLPVEVAVREFYLQGRPVRVIALRDITRRKQVEKELLTFRFALEQATDAIFMTDIQGVITYANPAFEKTYGFTRDETLGRTPRILKSGVIPPEGYAQFWNTLLSGQVVAGEITNKAKDGRLISVEGVNNPIVDAGNHIIGFMAVHRDVSASRRAEQAMARRAEELAAFNRVVQVAASSTDLRHILRTTAREVLQLIDLRNCGIGVFDDERARLIIIADASAHADDPSAEGVTIPVAGNASTERVLATKRSLVINNAQTDPLTAPIHDLMRARRTTGLMIVPLLRRGAIIGTVGCDITDPQRTFTADEVALVESVAGQLAGAIDNLRLFEDAQRRAEELATVVQVSSAASGTLNPQELLQTTVDLTKQNFRLYHAHIYVMNDPKDALVLAAGAGDVGRQMVEQGWRIRVDREQSLVARAARTRQPVVINNVRADAGWLPNKLLPDTQAEMALPLIAGGEVLGVLDVQADTVNRFADSDVKIMSTLAAQIATALQNARLFQQTEKVVGELNALTQRLTRDGWQEYVGQHHLDRQAYVYDLSQVRATTSPNGDVAPLEVTGLNYPLKVAGQTIGQLAVAETALPEAEAEEIMTAVADRLSAHLENLRLSEQTRSALAQTAEQASELSALFAAMPDVVLVYDRDGRYLRVAPTNPKLLYRPREDMLGKTVYEVLPAEQARTFHGYIQQVLATRRTLDVEYQLPIDGEVIHFSATLAPLTDNTVFWIARDITERKRAEDASDKRARELATVAQVSTVASTLLERQQLLNEVVHLTQQRFGLYHANIYLFDDVGQTLNLHAASGRVGQQMVDEGRSIPLLLEHSIVARAARERQAVVVNDVRAWQSFLPHPLLPNTRAEMAVPMLVGDRLLGVFDVQAEQAGRFSDEDVRIHNTLSAQVAVALQNAMLYAEQTATVARLKELDQLKSSFLANMSHELRTPLNSILGFTDVILEGLDGPLTGQMENDLKVVQKNGQHLLKLINDILDMAKIEAGRMTISPEPLQIADVVEEVVETTAPLAREKKLLLNIDLDAVSDLIVEADRMRLRQVLLNLVGNAIKFTERGSVTVTAENLGEHVLLCVKDTGIGIPSELVESVFEAFSQVDTSTTRKAGGTGLGLPISRHLIELHGGRLWAESSGIGGEGARFFVELPIHVQRPFTTPDGFVSEGYSG
jgi:PAS domain S-box-containing protein